MQEIIHTTTSPWKNRQEQLLIGTLVDHGQEFQQWYRIVQQLKLETTHLDDAHGLFNAIARLLHSAPDATPTLPGKTATQIYRIFLENYDIATHEKNSLTNDFVKRMLVFVDGGTTVPPTKMIWPAESELPEWYLPLEQYLETDGVTVERVAQKVIIPTEQPHIDTIEQATALQKPGADHLKHTLALMNTEFAKASLSERMKKDKAVYLFAQNLHSFSPIPAEAQIDLISGLLFIPASSLSELQKLYVSDVGSFIQRYNELLSSVTVVPNAALIQQRIWLLQNAHKSVTFTEMARVPLNAVKPYLAFMKQQKIAPLEADLTFLGK